MIIIERKPHGLGAEHPLWDDLQNLLILLFIIALIADGASQLFLGHSTVITNAISYPIFLFPAFILFGTGVYLIKESHKAALAWEKKPRFVDSGVYLRVRHPMYLGMLLIPLGLLFIEFSLIAFVIWIVFFLACDCMADYEEKDLVRILGKEYIDYQKRVPRWFARACITSLAFERLHTR